MRDSLAGETQVDWERARAFLRSWVAKHLYREDRDTVDDQTQIALVGLLRCIRTEGVRNLEALMTEIARRVSVDYVRKRRRWATIVGAMDEAAFDLPDARSPAPDRCGDPLERLQFEVLEFFRLHNSGCLELARHFFAEHNWGVVASRVGLEAATIRQRWSRCVAMLRKAARVSPDFLSEWSRWDA